MEWTMSTACLGTTALGMFNFIEIRYSILKHRFKNNVLSSIGNEKKDYSFKVPDTEVERIELNGIAGINCWL